jgi:hypothetical protein
MVHVSAMPRFGAGNMTQPLADRGIAFVAMPLPSCGDTDDELGACRRAVAAAAAAMSSGREPGLSSQPHRKENADRKGPHDMPRPCTVDRN